MKRIYILELGMIIVGEATSEERGVIRIPKSQAYNISGWNAARSIQSLVNGDREAIDELIDFGDISFAASRAICSWNLPRGWGKAKKAKKA